jgi:PAS domain S-box-containing protein
MPEPGAGAAPAWLDTVRLQVSPVLLARCSGLAVLLLGIIVLFGWALHQPALTTVLPGLASMKVNTAFCFVLAGAALALAPWTRARVTLIARACGVTVFAIAVLTLVEHMTQLDLALDNLLVPDPGDARNPPGRMALATSIAFVAAGTALWILPRAFRARPYLRQVGSAACIVIGATGAMGLIGYAVDLEAMYSWYALGTVALHTAAGLALLGTGLWLARAEQHPARTDDVTIARRATALIVLAAGTIGIASLVANRNETRLVLAEGFGATLDARTAQIRTTLRLRSVAADIIATRIHLLRQLRGLADNPQAGDRGDIQAIVDSFRTHGFTALVVTDARGVELARLGQRIESSQRALQVTSAVKTTLLWKDGVYVRHELPLADDEGFVGTVLAEQLLPEITASLMRSGAGFGETSELLLCGAEQQVFACFPTHLTPEAISLHAGSGALASLAQRALSGERGVAPSVDSRGRRLLVGYAPVGELGLVTLLTVESAEVYRPLGRQLQLVLLLIFAMSVAGYFFVRGWVRPLAATLEQRVRERTAELSAAHVRTARSEQRFRAAIEAAPTAMVGIDSRGAIVLVNAQTQRLFGYTQQELLGQQLEMLVPQRFRDVHSATRDNFFASPQARQMGAGRDLYALRKDGGEFPAEIGLSPIRTEEGLLVLSAIVDITERKAAADAVRQSEARLNFALEKSQIGGWDLDLRNHTAHRTLAHDRIFGYESLLPVWTYEMFREHVLPEDRAEVERRFVAATAAHAGWNFECRIRRVDGEVRWIWATGEHQFVDGGWRLAGIVQDVTERARQAAALKQANEALERSNMELQRFAYVASHDLQTPMRSIASFVGLLQTTYADKLDAQASDWIYRTVASIHSLQTLIRDLLDYSRLDAPGRAFESVACRDVFDHAVSLLTASIREAGAQVTCGELPTVNGDRSQLVQLMLNLVGNAIKYRSAAPPRIHVSAELTGQEWTFAVSDNGIGIAPRHHERIFEMFKRLHDQREFPGTGIGLAICRRIVHRHGGRIWVDSDTGKGSVFYFTIPTAGNGR